MMNRHISFIIIIDFVDFERLLHGVRLNPFNSCWEFTHYQHWLTFCDKPAISDSVNRSNLPGKTVHSMRSLIEGWMRNQKIDVVLFDHFHTTIKMFLSKSVFSNYNDNKHKGRCVSCWFLDDSFSCTVCGSTTRHLSFAASSFGSNL